MSNILHYRGLFSRKIGQSKKITNLLKTERSSSFLVCVTKVPLLLTLPLHVWCCLQHVALWKLTRPLFQFPDI